MAMTEALDGPLRVLTCMNGLYTLLIEANVLMRPQTTPTLSGE
ncbi:MAG: hypothetical protein QW613_03055 [Thermoprotei archaeon]